MLKTLKKTAKKYTRRVLEGVHHSKEGSGDSEREFNDLVARFCDIEKNLKQFHQHVEDYISSLKDACTLQACISGDLLYFFDTKSENRVHADKYHTICTNMHLKRWTELSETLKEAVLDPLAKHLSLFPTVKEMIKKRKRKLTDVQAYRRQVLHLAKAGKTKNPEKFKRKSDKLCQAEKIFDRIHGDLVSVLESYDKSREELLVQYTWKIMQAQHTFLDNFQSDTKPLRDTSAIFKKNAKDGNSQVEERLSQMVLHFKSGDYASDAASMPPSPNPDGDHQTDVRASPKSEKRERKAAELKCYLNPPFDITLPFELRHKMWAPGEKDYMASKNEALRSGTTPIGMSAKAANNTDSGMHLNKRAFCGKEKAMYEYISSEQGELSIRTGDVIEVVERRSDGWWLGRLRGSLGTFPCNYTQPILQYK